MQSTLADGGPGPSLVPWDIGHPDYTAVIEPDTAFWSLVPTRQLTETLSDESFLAQVSARHADFQAELQTLRFGLAPSAVYFNPTERCNLNCTYCYLPERMRLRGAHMSQTQLFDALEILREFFARTLPAGERPQVIFHGAEPLLNRRAVFAAIDHYAEDFTFGVQTNGTVLNARAIEFLTSRRISLGLSLDGHLAGISDRTRRTHGGRGVYRRVVEVLEALRGYDNHSVICTATTANLRHLSELVTFFHGLEVPTCMLNPVRCTLSGGAAVKPADHELSAAYLRALDRSAELYAQTGRKLVVANFANILLAIIAPTARRLMCDISPCGGGRCFFAVDARGGLFPCSEFIGLDGFSGGNLFEGGLDSAFGSEAFSSITTRTVERIDPCARCVIRHYCGAPCPAEANELHGGTTHPGAFCQFYEEQARYALRVIAEGRENDYLWDNWDARTSTVFEVLQ